MAVLTTDQRGDSFARIVNNTVDMGAFESGAGHPWHNGIKTQDVTNDNIVVPNDVTKIILHLNVFGASDVPANAKIGQPYGFMDVTGDNLAPNDLTAVILYLNAFGVRVESPSFDIQTQEADSGSAARVSDIDALVAMLAVDASQQVAMKKRARTLIWSRAR